MSDVRASEAAPATTSGALAGMVEGLVDQVYARVLGFLRRHGLQVDEEADYDPERHRVDDPVLASCYEHALRVPQRRLAIAATFCVSGATVSGMSCTADCNGAGFAQYPTGTLSDGTYTRTVPLPSSTPNAVVPSPANSMTQPPSAGSMWQATSRTTAATDTWRSSRPWTGARYGASTRAMRLMGICG